MGAAVLALSAWYIDHHIREVDWAKVGQSLSDMGPGEVIWCLVAVIVAFWAVGGQERAVVAHMGLPIGREAGARAAMAAAAVSQSVGFGPVIGAMLRRRMIEGLTLGQSFAISAGMAVGFFAGVAVLALISLVMVPDLGWARPAAAALLVLTLGVGGLALRGSPMPNLFILGRFLAWVAVDLGALAMVLWLALPEGAAPDFLRLLPVFLISLGAAVATGSPGGLGPFEAAMLTHLPMIDQEALVAAIIVFRVLAYLVPMGCGALWLVIGRRGRMGRSPAQMLERPERAALLALPWAEAHLVRQGALGLMGGMGGWLWLTGRLAHSRVVLGDPSGPNARALDAARAQARQEGRVLCLYKVGPRMAALARQAGFRLLPVAREAVLNPQDFTTAGSARARLRRKLSHARKAGIEIIWPERLPYSEMADVAAAWKRRQGRERGFSMGRWDAAYVAGQQVVLARDGKGRLVAFVSLNAGPREWVLDLVRFTPDAPDGTIYALLCQAIEAARIAGISRLSLAAVPEPGFGVPGLAGRLVERAMRRHQGLAQFKAAFAPDWERRYVGAASWPAMVLACAELARAILRPPRLIPVPYAEFLIYDGAWDRDEPDMMAEAQATPPPNANADADADAA